MTFLYFIKYGGRSESMDPDQIMDHTELQGKEQ